MSRLPAGWRLAREPDSDIYRLLHGGEYVAIVFRNHNNWTARLAGNDHRWAWEAPLRRDVVDQAIDRYNKLTGNKRETNA